MAVTTLHLALRRAYSYVEIAYGDGELPTPDEVEAAWILVGMLDEGDHENEQTFSDGTPLPSEDSAPRNDADTAPADRQPARPQQGGKRGSGLFCPDHTRIELIQSADQYQQWDEGPSGEKVAAKFFCPGKENGTGRNHSIWRSRALVPEAV